ncbi:MAG: hypothetical protein ACTSYJ_06110 [Candidatus Thorarchaeota archaeon]
MSWRGVAGKMADEPSKIKTLRKRGDGDPGFRTLDSLYYDYTCEG